MSVRQDKYQVGDVVEWTDDYADYADCYLTKSHGNGPFTIHAVEDVPFEVYGDDYEYPDDDACKNSYESVGHTQWVRVMTPKGDEEFSGHFFKPVRSDEE
jgi:hypothetical protein